MLTIPDSILNFAKYIAPKLVPNKRASGWQELASETRGTGDLLDLIGSLIVLDKLTDANKVCKMDITCGTGDKCDIEVRVKNEFKKINIKTSSYAPFREGLNLYVKQEEIDKDIDAYIQCFVHLSESNHKPHIHLAGWIPTVSNSWQQCKSNIITIPNTDGHKGIRVPIDKLGPFDSFIKIVDNKF